MVGTTASPSNDSSATTLKRVPTSATLFSVEKAASKVSNRSSESLIPRYHQPRAITFNRSAHDDDLARTPPTAPTSSDFLDHVPLLSHTPSASTTSSALESVVSPILTGRPRVRDILADVVAQTPRSGSVVVATCGPVGLTDEVGAACSDMIDPGKVSRGENRLNIVSWHLANPPARGQPDPFRPAQMLRSEVFGW